MLKKHHSSRNYRSGQEINLETYEQYLLKKTTITIIKDKWIKDIIEGVSLHKSIVLLNDPDFVVIPPRSWDGCDMNKIHLLAFVKNFKINTLRDLTYDHIPLLLHIYDTVTKFIEETCKINKNKFRVYIHYPPTSWVLHIHFNLITNLDITSSVEYTHSLSSIITNIKIKSDYYQSDMHILSDK